MKIRDLEHQLCPKSLILLFIPNNVVVTSKQNNSGWRIDYWLVSDRLADKITEAGMIDSGERRDHTPIILEIDL